MIYGICPFLSDKVDLVYDKILKNNFYLDNKIDKSANDLIINLL